jgi:hypothetical protein
LNGTGRRLLIVPIVHSGVELGSELGAARSKFVAKFGEAAWVERNGTIDAYWRDVSGLLMSLPLQFEQLNIYQDSLPTVGDLGHLVTELADRGSPNHRLIRQLLARGAKLIGTESIELLLAEYRLVKDGVADETLIRASLEARDRFIAERIDATLASNATAILFIGAAHNVARFLKADIKVGVLTPNGWKQEAAQ